MDFSLLETSFKNSIAVHISTMTVFYNLDIINKKTTTDIVSVISDTFQNDPTAWKGLTDKYRVRLPGSRKTKSKSFRSFSNSVSLIFDDIQNKRTICAKVFRNGGVQVTGCQSEQNAADVAQDMRKLIASISDASNVVINNQTINMINVVCDIKTALNGKHLDLAKLNSILWNQSKIYSKYDRDKYFGLNVKIPLYSTMVSQDDSKKKMSIQDIKRQNPEATVLVFMSGSFVITGVKSQAHIDMVYDKFIKVFEQIIMSGDGVF